MVCENPPVCANETCAPGHGGVLNTGLTLAWLNAICALSIGVFLFWGGALWMAAPGDSHALRIGVSYAVTIPLVVGALLCTRTFSLRHAVSATAVLWAVKLVITSSLYALLVPDGVDRYAPRRAWESASSAPATIGYRPGGLPGERTELKGAAPAGAVVALAAPPPGLPAPEPRTWDWTIAGGRHDEPVRLAWAGDTLRVSSRDPVLHTLRIVTAGRAVANVPLVAGVAPRALPAPPPGVYDLLCENHAQERAVLVVVDHPYATRADANGSFVLKGVPAGRHDVCIYPAKIGGDR